MSTANMQLHITIKPIKYDGFAEQFANYHGKHRHVPHLLVRYQLFTLSHIGMYCVYLYPIYSYTSVD